jgi:hypothetical protein
MAKIESSNFLTMMYPSTSLTDKGGNLVRIADEDLRSSQRCDAV